ncbi:hypothetical protein Halha_1019 [Halobacteroides halobius DSM 5150]|uniref:Uncharacterized protein n=1 Tax=Halobacteroides halobius (strain ATCC 35273 / DSM 5150 / MD-1) TaxID=748449 RepID=L0K8V8_HALHC|nr:hypothetical protein [Halobacteroides halobius]AGB40980.1 hypothetical protein Halha_1019 [Halobacteroides halobius DSM 5150]
MKKFSLILVFTLLLNFGLAPLAFANEATIDFQKKIFKYEEEKKNPLAAAGMSFVLPSSGHAYSGNWKRGLIFLGIEAIEAGIMISRANKLEEVVVDSFYHNQYMLEDNVFMLARIALLATKAWEAVDSYQTAKEYNKNLKEELGLRPQLSVTSDQVKVSIQSNF